MGDRAVIFCHDASEFSPGIYTHWAGSEVPAMLKKAAPKMRGGDVSYAAARLCGVFHEILKGDVGGLGLLPPPDNGESSDWEKESHGNAGVFLVNVDTGEVRNFKGGKMNTLPFTLTFARD